MRNQLTMIYALEDRDNSVRLTFPIHDWFLFHDAPFLAPGCTGVMFRHDLCGNQSAWGYFRGCDADETVILEPDCALRGKEGRENTMIPHAFGPERFGPLRDAIMLDFAPGHLHADAVLERAKARFGPPPTSDPKKTSPASAVPNRNRVKRGLDARTHAP